jgi:protein-S-isoprenylcysteine O-methyltransferase Ste14
MEAMLLIPWLLGIGYGSIPLFWLAIHPFAATWRRLHWSPYCALLPIWAVVIMSEIWITWPWHALRLYSAPSMWLAALPFFILGWRTYRRIFAEFGGRNLSGASEIRNKTDSGSVVKTGMHARMRHPIYFAHLCNFAGLTIGSGQAVNFVLLAISLIVTYPLMIALEERELEKRFGASYREYKESVPLLPLLFLSNPLRRNTL